jgi:hypothetical protein
LLLHGYRGLARADCQTVKVHNVLTGNSLPIAPIRRPSAATVVWSTFCGLWSLAWAVPAAYAFLCSRLPVPNLNCDGCTFPGSPAWWGPSLVSVFMPFVSILLIAAGVILLFPVAVAGALRIRAHHAGRQSMIMWLAAVLAAFAVEAAFVLDFGGPDPENYVGRIVINWSRLMETAAFVAVGMAMVKILIGAARSAVSPEP